MMTSLPMTPEPIDEEEEGPRDAVLVTDADSETGQVLLAYCRRPRISCFQNDHVVEN